MDTRKPITGQFARLIDMVEDRVNTTGTAPKSVACGTTTKRTLNAELLEVFGDDNGTATVVQRVDCGHGMMDLYADLRLPADGMELRDEPCGVSCAE